MRFLREEKISGVLLAATEGARILGELSRAKVPVVFGPFTLSSNPEWLELPAKLAEAGIPVAFCTEAPRSGAASLRFTAAVAVMEGLDSAEALRGLTLTPAAINAARDVHLLVAGASKRVALEAVLERDVLDWTVGNVTIWTDRDPPSV